ncbi:MAG: hypothetical protein ACFFDP_10320 [Promethearchaeota archaeon]
MQLTIILDAPRCHTTDDFLIRDVPGTSGRLDVVCRILAATFHTVPQLNQYLRFLAILGGPPNPPLRLSVSSATTENVPESELACALILKGLIRQYRTEDPEEYEIWPQFSLARKSFGETLQETAKTANQIYYLVEKGSPFEKIHMNLTKPIAFIVGDDQGLPPEHEEQLSKYDIQRVSIGEQSYLGSQVVTLVLLELARKLKF